MTVDMVLPWSNIVVGPYAGDAQVNQVEFIKSSVKMKDCPKDQLPEFAVIGRSNVGKSSLINRLVKRKEIALTSKNPGYGFFCFDFPPPFLSSVFLFDGLGVGLCREDTTH